MSIAELEIQALELPIADRVALLNALLESIDPNHPSSRQLEVDASWSAEAKRRVAEYVQNGRTTAVDAREAASRIREQLGR